MRGSRWQGIFLALGVLIVVGEIVFAGRLHGGPKNPTPVGEAAAQTATPTDVSSTPTAAPSPAQAVFIGDGTTKASGFPALVSRRLHWRPPVVLADPDAGYTAAPTFTSQLARAVDAKPDVVVLVGGINDRAAGRAVESATTSTLRRMRRRLPDAELVVVAPPFGDADPPQDVAAVRSAIKAAATQLPRTTYIDPISDRWLSGASPRLISKDGTKTTRNGQARMARLLGAELVDRGVIKRPG